MPIYPKRKIRGLLKNGDYDKALELGKSLESRYAKDSDFMFIMGSAYYLVDEFAKAIDYFERSLELNDRDPDTLSLKTNAHLALKQKDEAIKCVELLLEINPKNDEALDILEQLRNV